MRARFRKKESRSFFLSICAQLAFNVKTTSFWYDLWAGGNSVIESIKGGLFYENSGERMTVKLRKGSQIPAYMAYPRFLLTMDISETAKLVYVLLLDRARLSMKNEGWEDEQGHVFIYYTIADLASASGKSEMTVKNALAVLEQKNFISRKRQGLRKTYTQDARDRLQKAHGKQYSPITMMEAQQDVDHLLREDERKLEPPAQKRPVRHQPEPQKKPPKRDYER